jgi:hypothetical protein
MIIIFSFNTRLNDDRGPDPRQRDGAPLYVAQQRQGYNRRQSPTKHMIIDSYGRLSIYSLQGVGLNNPNKLEPNRSSNSNYS